MQAMHPVQPEAVIFACADFAPSLKSACLRLTPANLQRQPLAATIAFTGSLISCGIKSAATGLCLRRPHHTSTAACGLWPTTGSEP
jgi:hypothetical protein